MKNVPWYDFNPTILCACFLCRRDSESLKTTSKTSTSQPKLILEPCWRRPSSSRIGWLIIFFLLNKMAIVWVFLECILLTFPSTTRSRKLIQESDQHLKDVEKILQNDKRYLVLECVPEERRKLIMFYIEDLDRRGPPPPPTASEPTRRSTKWPTAPSSQMVTGSSSPSLARAWPGPKTPRTPPSRPVAAGLAVLLLGVMLLRWCTTETYDWGLCVMSPRIPELACGEKASAGNVNLRVTFDPSPL